MEEYDHHKLTLMGKDYMYLSLHLKEIKDIYQKGTSLIAEAVNNSSSAIEKKVSIKSSTTDSPDSTSSDTTNSRCESATPYSSTTTTSLPLTEIPPKFKKLFRQIMMITHPDKFKEELGEEKKWEYKKVFERVMELYEKESYPPLLFYGAFVGIKIDKDLFEQEIEFLTLQIKRLEIQIKEIKTSPPWKFYMEYTESEKKILIKKMIDNLVK